jgi:hypothetical protein
MQKQHEGLCVYRHAAIRRTASGGSA